MIPSSELIINSNGSIYHLCLEPGELAETILTVGDPERVPEVSKHFDKVELTRSHREIVTHTGFVGSKRISVISTGMGTDNIDIVLNEIDALFNIDFKTREVKSEITSLNIIRLGTSGSLQADIPLDSIVASAYAVGLDGLLDYYDNTPISSDNNLMSFTSALEEFFMEHDFHFSTYETAASSDLLMHFNSYQKGITITAPGFYAPQGRALRAKPFQPDFVNLFASFKFQDLQFTNMEMETAGIYGLGNLLGHRYLSISAILANRVNNTFSTKSSETVEKMIVEALEKIERI